MNDLKKLSKKNKYLKGSVELHVVKDKIEYFNRGKDIHTLHKKSIDKIIDSLNSTLILGINERERINTPIGINAKSLNTSIRKNMSIIKDINFETSVINGSFIPLSQKSDFDFSIYDKETNYYNFWNYCYGLEARKKGPEIFKKYFSDSERKKEWEKYMSKYENDKYTKDLIVPSTSFNIIGEIQFGNWAMVYKDMFRLVAAMNKGAKIDLYVYICSTGLLKTLLSDQIVYLDKAIKEFKENVNNHNITVPIMIIPIDIDENSFTENNYKNAFNSVHTMINEYNDDVEELIKLQEEKKAYENSIDIEIIKPVKNMDDISNKIDILKKEMHKKITIINEYLYNPFE